MPRVALERRSVQDSTGRISNIPENVEYSRERVNRVTRKLTHQSARSLNESTLIVRVKKSKPIN